MATLLIQNGTILDPSRVFEQRKDLLIRDGKIVEDYINPGFEEKYGRESKKDNANPIDQG